MKKENKDAYKNIVKILESLCLLLCFVGTFAWIWYEKIGHYRWQTFENKGNMLVIMVYAAVLILFMSALGGFLIGTYRKSSVALSQIIALVGTDVVMYVVLILVIGNTSSIGRLTVNMLGLLAVQIVISMILIVVETNLFRKIYPPKRMIVVYENKAPEHIIQKFAVREDKYTIESSVKADSNWKTNMQEAGVYEAVLLYDITSQYRNDILKYCFENDIQTYIVPKISDILVRNATELNLFDTPVLEIKNSEITIEQRFLKRLMDIVISLAGIIITSPIILVTAIAIHVYDKGPVFFKQNRCTMNGEVYQIYKFRSMIVDAEKDGVARLATENDDRITPIGHFIRKTRIDEIPQFFNILKGDMSVVGPRPERPEIIAEYCKEFPEFSYRTKMKAGLTGYAQVYGKYNTTSYDKLKWDLMYIQKFSILLDLKLIIMTVKIVFMKESTEGLEDGQVNANSTDKE